MPRDVPTFPTNFTLGNTETDPSNTIRAGTPVLAPGQWRAIGATMNWLIGRGGVLASANPYRLPFVAGNPEVLFRYWTFPRRANASVAFLVTLRPNTSAYATGVFTVYAPVATKSWSVLVPGTAQRTPRRFIFFKPKPIDATPQEMRFGLIADSNSPGAFFLDGITIYEVPRFQLTSGLVDGGVNLDSIVSSEAIYHDSLTVDDKSVEAVGRRGALMPPIPRKNHLFSWYQPSGVPITATAYTGLFDLEPHVMVRKIRSGVTVLPMRWNVYASVTGGSGDVRLTNSHGSSTINVTSTSPTWHTVATLDTDTEDPLRWDIDGGIPSGGRDPLVIEARKNVSGTLFVFGIGIGE